MRKKEKPLIKVQPSGRLDTGIAYKLRVVATTVSVKRQVVDVVMRHMDRSQFGRSCRTTLHLPPTPENLTGEFFAAAGMPLLLDQVIDPEAVVGAIVKARFAPAPKGGDCEITTFEPITKETGNVLQLEQ